MAVVTAAPSPLPVSAPQSKLACWPQDRAAGEQDAPHYDYCLLPYTPRATTPSDLMSVNVLRWSWEAHGVLAEGEALLQRLRTALGPNQVVWGIKQRAHQPDATSWELYFYRRPHNPPNYTLARIAELFAPMSVEGVLADHWRWLMFSVEFDVQQLRGTRPCTSNVYIESSGLSYKLRAGQPPDLENHYLFSDPLTGIDDILARLQVSVHATPDPLALARLLPPQWMRCHHVCVANKRFADAVYWSRVDMHQLEFFLQRHAWPETLRDNIHEHRQQFQHLNWDIGVDFQRAADDQNFMFIKSGLYGSC